MNNILHQGYEDGRRFRERVPYKPYLFVDSRKASDTKYKNIKGQPVEKIEFDSIGDQREFSRKYKGIANFDIYGITNHPYLFLNDEYSGESCEYDSSLIRVINIDIEVAADEGFPDPATASKPITAITMKMKENIACFGCGDFVTTDPRVTYYQSRDEMELLRDFIRVWREWDPDVVTGWYIESFDIPYIINRVTNILNFDAAKALSPFGIIDERKFANDGNIRQDILGITLYDYMSLYKKFTYTQQESYSLDNISSVELGEKKLDYSEYDGLFSLYKNDYQKFMEYNIKDVDLVDKLDKKLGLIELGFAIAYDAKVNLIDAFTSVRMWDIIIHNYLLAKNIVVPSYNYQDKERLVEGAYVKDPQVGMHKWVVSFDLNSLYPHLIMQYNIGPDTFHSHLPTRLGVQEIIDGKLNQPELRSYINKHNLTVAGSSACYTRDYRSFMSTLMGRMYKQRSEFKDQMLAVKQKQEDTGEDLSSEISKLDNMQMAKKIQLNSAYGAFGNAYFRWFDIKYAESITLSGQLAIRWIEKHINEYMNKTLSTENKDYVIACDTDSMYITLDELVYQTFEGKTPSSNDIIDWMDLAARRIFEPYIDKSYTNLAAYVNAYEQKMVMKREALADKGFWTAKKRYVLHVHDMEGVRYAKPFLKIMGIETQRSSVPKICRDNMKAAIKLIMEKDEDALMKYVDKFKNHFNSLPFEDVAFPRGVRGLNKYRNNVTLYNKGTPIHVRGALVYNNMLKQHDLENVYNNIYDGDKIKFCYLRLPNPTRENVIAVVNSLPKQFNIESYIDYNKQFEKSFMEPMKTIANAIKWKLERGQATLEEFF
jgi:DNA polymerase elongation subunit (family B)